MSLSSLADTEERTYYLSIKTDSGVRLKYVTTSLVANVVYIIFNNDSTNVNWIRAFSGRSACVRVE